MIHLLIILAALACFVSAAASGVAGMAESTALGLLMLALLLVVSG